MTDLHDTQNAGQSSIVDPSDASTIQTNQIGMELRERIRDGKGSAKQGKQGQA